MQFSDINQWIESYVGDNTFIFEMFITVFVTLLINFTWRRIYQKLDRQLKRTHNDWDDAFIMAISTPISLLIWGFGGWIIARFMLEFEIKDEMRDVFIVAVVSWSIVRFIRQAENNLISSNKDLSRDEKIDKSTVEAISKLLRVSVIITTILLILQNLGISISAVLAFGGIGGIAIGFAAKDLLANFFGGLIIYLDRPFSVGDWIRSPDRQIEGTVENIGWRQTRIRTFDKRPLYVPNAVFNSIAVENPSRMTNRRIYETFGVRYDDIKQAESIIKQVKTMLIAHPEIESNLTLIVNLNAFNDASVDFFVYTFTKTTDWVTFHQIKQDILLNIAGIIEANNAEMAYPTQRILLEDLNLS